MLFHTPLLQRACPCPGYIHTFSVWPGGQCLRSEERPHDVIEKAGPYPNNYIQMVAHTLSGAPIAPDVVDKINEAVIQIAKDEQIVVNITYGE